jgi:hypothetical protein
MGGKIVMIAVLASCAIAALTALLHPIVLSTLRRTDAAVRSKMRHRARFSAFILFCALARALNLSIAGHILNVAAIVGIMVCAGFLIAFAFTIRPVFVGSTVGLLAGVAWLAGLLICVMSAVFDDSPVTVQLDDGLICRETVYGFAAGDAGEIMDIYRRYLFIDHRLLSQMDSDAEPEQNTPPPPAFSDTLARCRARVNAARGAAAHLP